MTTKDVDSNNTINSNNGNSSIRTIVEVVFAMVMILVWGISIGVNYQRMNGIELSQSLTRDRIDKLEKVVNDGMQLRLNLQKDVGYLTIEVNKANGKLDNITDLLNEHLRNDNAVQKGVLYGKTTMGIR